MYNPWRCLGPILSNSNDCHGDWLATGKRHLVSTRLIFSKYIDSDNPILATVLETAECPRGSLWGNYSLFRICEDRLAWSWYHGGDILIYVLAVDIISLSIVP